MSVKYRVRLKTDRVVGPFVAEEVGELFLKGHISGEELCQQFPIGEWKPIDQFQNLILLFADITKKKQQELQAVQELPPAPPATQQSPESTSDIAQKDPAKSLTTNLTNEAEGTGKEFKITPVDIDINYDEVDKRIQEEEKQREKEIEEELEKTRVIRRESAKPSSDLEKTRVIPSKASMPKKDKLDFPGSQTEEEEESLELKPPKKKGKTYKQQEQTATNIDELIANELTVVANLSQVLAKVNAELSASEVELDQLQRIEENQEKIKQKETDEIKDGEFEHEDDGGEDISQESESPRSRPKTVKKKKKGMSMIVAFAFLALFYVLLSPDEKPKATGPAFVVMKFPIILEVEDAPGAQASLAQGRMYYAKNTYMGKIQASEFFLNSLSRKFESNEALGELVLTYSELLEDTQDLKVSANTIYKLVTLSENRMLVDLNTVMGAANFFGKIGKNQTGINLIKNYMRAKGAISAKLLSYYLDLLMNAGELVEARKILNKLSTTPVKPIESYMAMSRFYEINDQLAEARNQIEDGLKYYPDSVKLLLKYSDHLFKEQAFSNLEQTLKRCEKLQVEGSPSYLAKYFYYMGLLSASKNKNKEATIFFKKSLKIKETDELRSMLSSLEVAGDNVSQTLILESKVIDLLKKANVEYKNKNLEAAFSFTIEALDAMPSYVPAILFHTKLQLTRGLFSSAVDNLQRAIASNPANPVLKKTLVETYVHAFKFEEAQKMLQELSQLPFAYKSEYASLMGDFYTAKANLPMAVRWYNEALNRDPLSDYDMYQIAKILVRSKKFSDAKTRLSKALVLDPKNVNYLATYSDILFEQDNTDTAIGYLRDAISEIGEDPKLISAIALLYYRSGQIKEFQSYYKKVQAMPKKDEAFYEFLVKASKLEDSKADYVKYCQELLKLNPGNLQIRLELGEYFYENKQYEDAMEQFNEIKDKLISYPKVHFWLAKVYLATNDLKKAKDMANKELELNPSLDSAHFISGEVARAEKDYREAVLKYEKAIGLNPKSVDALMSMAWIRLAQNYASESLELYNRALREEPGNPEIHKQMGRAYVAAGQRALAREKFEDYLKLNPAAPDKDQIEAQIKSLQ